MCSQRAENEFDLIVVGAGASGQMAAIVAAERGMRVALLEQMPKAGLKLLASGGGRANLTNTCSLPEFQAAFGRQGRFMAPALEELPPAALREKLAKWGVPTTEDDQGRVHPASQKATDVQAALWRRLEQLDVAIYLNCRVSRLLLEAGQLAGAETSHGPMSAPRVLLACGGRSWPELGGTGGGYPLARQAGHELAPLTPALVPLITRESWPAELAGLSLSEVRLWIPLPKQPKAGVTGDVLFTHRGLSGPVVINFSGQVAQLLERRDVLPLRLELEAGTDAAAWSARMEQWRTGQGKRGLLGLLRETIPASLARQMLAMAKVGEETPAAQLSGAGRQALAGLLGGLELTVTGTEGFGQAFVTRGGVKLKEVNPNTLESRLLPGLYFTGELLDLDGPTGGFNLQWAFASGALAGQSRLFL